MRRFLVTGDFDLCSVSTPLDLQAGLRKGVNYRFFVPKVRSE
jgi:hypothetical protein